MSFPCQLSLRRFPEGVRLCRQPIDEIKNLRLEGYARRDIVLQPGENPLAGIAGDLFDIRAEFELAGAKDFGKKQPTPSAFGIVTRGEAIRYSVPDKTVSCLGGVAPLEPLANRIKLQILVDRSSIEVFGNDGRISMSTVFFPDANDTGLEIFTTGGEVYIVSLEVNRLEPVWLEADARLGHPRHAALIERIPGRNGGGRS
jgi:levanase/fructan beta-fructosidase